MLYTICIALILIASVLAILAVLVQNPKSGMAANFGASNQVMGVRETTNFLEKFTWTMAIAMPGTRPLSVRWRAMASNPATSKPGASGEVRGRAVICPNG